MDAPLKVAVRMRPLLSKEEASVWSCTDHTVTHDQKGSTFYFDHVFGPQLTSDSIYDKLLKDMVTKAMEGFHGTFITYGQSGSGKTFTTDALATLAVKNIFGYIENCPTREFLLRISYIELYNERLSDLLSSEETTLSIREDVSRNISIEGLVEEAICSEEDAINHLVRGNEKRRFAETKLNERSSRAHCIIRIVIESRAVGDVENSSVFVSHLHLVDLAGSEKAGENVGDRFREGCSINKSLLALSQVIRKLSEGQSNLHINYRDSKLTRILQNGLGGNSRTSIICTISPCSVEESVSTLRFAMNAKKVKNKPHQNEVVTDAAMLKKYRSEIVHLNKRINELVVAPNSQSLELEKRQKQVEYLKSLLLVSAKEQEPSRGKEDRRRRETVCIPQVNRYNRFRPTKMLPDTPVKAVEEKSVVLDSSLERAHNVLDVGQIQHRLESPCPTSACQCHNLSFTEFEKTFVDQHTQTTLKKLKAQNMELRLLLRKSVQNVKHHESTEFSPSEAAEEHFQDGANISWMVEESQSVTSVSNITMRRHRRLLAVGPSDGDLSTQDFPEYSSSSGPKEDSPETELKAHDETLTSPNVAEELLDGSQLMNQSQPFMDVSMMALNQSLLLPRMSHVVDKTGQVTHRLFDSIEMEKEFLEQFESLVNEKQDLERIISRLEHKLKIKSANEALMEARDKPRHSNVDFKDVKEDVDVKREFEVLERRREEMESEGEEIQKRAMDLKLQEERIEGKIDLLCEKEETIEDRLEVVEAKEREIAEKEADFLRMELELKRKKQGLERIHDERTNRECDGRNVGLNEEPSKEDPSNQPQVVDADFNRAEDELQRTKQQLEAERAALEQKAAELREQEDEMARIKTEMENHRAGLEQMACGLKQQEEALNEDKSELDRKKEELQELAVNLQQQTDDLDKRRRVVEDVRSELEKPRMNSESKEITGQNDGMDLKKFGSHSSHSDHGADAENSLAKEMGKKGDELCDKSVLMIEERQSLGKIAAKLEREREELVKDRDDLEEERRKFKENLQQEKHEMECKRAEFEKMTKCLETRKNDIDDEWNKLKPMRTDFDRQKGDLPQIKEEREDEQKNTKEMTIKEMDRKKEELDEISKHLENQTTEMEEERRRLEGMSEDLERQGERLENETEDMERERRALKETRSRSLQQEEEMEEERTCLEAMRVDLERRKEELAEEQRKFADTRMSAVEDGHIADELRRERDEIEEQRQTLEEVEAQFNIQRNGLQQEKERLEEERVTFEEVKAQCDIQRNGLQQEKERLEEEWRTFQVRTEDFEQQKDNLEKEKENMKEEKSRFEEMTLHLEGQKDEFQRHKDEIMQEKINDLERRERELIADKGDVHVERNKLKDITELVNRQRDELDRERESFEEQWREMDDMQVDLRRQEHDLFTKRDELEREKSQLEETASDFKRREEAPTTLENREEDEEACPQPDGPTEVTRKPEDVARIEHLERVIEKGKKVLSQKLQTIGESQESISTLTKRIKELEEKEKQIEQQEETIQQLKADKEAKRSSEAMQINTLTYEVEILERKAKKLEVRNQENIEYYTLVLDRQKRTMRQGQDLGSSYLDPSNENARSEDISKDLEEELDRLRQQHSNLQAKYETDTSRYAARIEHLKKEKEKVLAMAKEEIKRTKAESQPVVMVAESQTPGTSKDQIQTLASKVDTLERENKKLDKRNRENIEYYTLVIEKHKELSRKGQNLGESYLQPSTHSKTEVSCNRDGVQAELESVKEEHKELQAKYAATASEYEQLLQRLSDNKNKDHQQRRPLQNLQQEQQSLPPMATSGGIVDYVLMLNKDREIRKLRKLLEKCHCE